MNLAPMRKGSRPGRTATPPFPDSLTRKEQRRRRTLRCVYEVDDQDVVVPLTDMPAASPGAPEPVVLADEGSAVVAYYASDNLNWDTAQPEDLGDEHVVVLRFHEVHSLMFGVPDDEALSGHPLAGRGLTAYGAFRIDQSSWIRRLERMNAVHPRHSAAAYSSLFHFILTFHDSTFECVCGSAPTASIVQGTTPHEAAVAAPRPEEPWPAPRTRSELRNQSGAE
jgi:hypothetical protein